MLNSKLYITSIFVFSLFGCGGDKGGSENKINNSIGSGTGTGTGTKTETETDKNINPGEIKDKNTDLETNNSIKPEEIVNIDAISLKSIIYTQQKSNSYSSLDSLNVLFSTDKITDGSESISCKWYIAEIEVSNNCKYQLKKGEHLLPITVSAQLKYKEQITEPFVHLFFNVFPIQQVNNKYSQVTLFNDGNVLEWEHILDGNFAYHAENFFEKIPSVDNNKFTSIYANLNSFSGVKEDGLFYLWGPKVKNNEALINDINIEGVKKVSSSNDYFSVLTNMNNVYVIGRADIMNKKLNVYNVIDLLTTESAMVLQTKENQACLVETLDNISCVDIQGNITHITELKYDYKGDYAVLTDQGYLYRWGRFAKTQGELVSDNITNIIANNSAFAFLRSDASVGVWGDKTKGGEFTYDYYFFKNINSTPTKIHTVHALDQDPINVKKIVAALGSFAALTFDGKVITWGSIFSGGNIYSKPVNHVDELINVIDVLTNTMGYATIHKNKRIISWQGIWEIYTEISFGEYIKYYNYDKNKPQNTTFIDGHFSVSPEKISALSSNDGAYFLAEVTDTELTPHFYIKTWGYKSFGATLSNKKVPGKIEKVFPYSHGFTVFTDQGGIYHIKEDQFKKIK